MLWSEAKKELARLVRDGCGLSPCGACDRKVAEALDILNEQTDRADLNGRVEGYDQGYDEGYDDGCVSS